MDGDLYDDFKLLAQYTYGLIEGDTHTINEIFSLLRKYNLIDHDEEWIYYDEAE